MIERQTKQRTAIAAIVQEADRPLSPQEILAAARSHLPRLGQATVYRAIRTLLAEGRLKAVEIPGEPPRYEPAGKAHHHHFHCRSCDRVFEVEGCPGALDRLVPRGFHVEGHEVMLYGRCAACAKRP